MKCRGCPTLWGCSMISPTMLVLCFFSGYFWSVVRTFAVFQAMGPLENSGFWETSDSPRGPLGHAWVIIW